MSRDTSPAGRRGRALRLALLASLALNLLILGTVAGSVLSGRGLAPPPRVDLSLGPLTRALEPEDRRAVVDRLRERDDMRPPRPRERRAQLEAMVAALRAEPFDAAEVDRLLSDQRARATAAVTAGQEALVARIRQMTPEARAAFADRLSRELRRRDGPPRDGDRDAERGGD